MPLSFNKFEGMLDKSLGNTIRLAVTRPLKIFLTLGNRFLAYMERLSFDFLRRRN